MNNQQLSMILRFYMKQSISYSYLNSIEDIPFLILDINNISGSLVRYSCLEASLITIQQIQSFYSSWYSYDRILRPHHPYVLTTHTLSSWWSMYLILRCSLSSLVVHTPIILRLSLRSYSHHQHVFVSLVYRYPINE
jgi:hypothetical protein